MIDPSITGRVGLAGPSGNTREAKWRRRRRNGWKAEISVEEKGESKKKRSQG